MNDVMARTGVANRRRRTQLSACILGVLAVSLVANGCSGDALDASVPTPPWLADAGADGGDAGATAVDAGDANATAAGDVVARADSAVDDAGGQAAETTVAYYATWTEFRVRQQDPSPFGSSWQESRTVTIGLAQVTWTGDTGVSLQQPCAMAASAVHGSQVSFPGTFVKGLPVAPIPVQRAAGAIVQPKHIGVVGLKLGHSGPLPANGDAGHPAVIDSDGDGAPGATVLVDIPLFGAEQMQIVQRTTRAWQATAADNGTLTAEPEVVIEQATIAATLDLLLTAVNEKPADGPPERLLWVPVAAETSCSDLVGGAPALLGKPWPP